jgi:hypothetical protein
MCDLVSPLACIERPFRAQRGARPPGHPQNADRCRTSDGGSRAFLRS